MEEQNYKKHVKTVPMYHFVLFGILLLTLIGSFVNLYRAFSNYSHRLEAALVCALSVAAVLQTLFARLFPLRAQDRAIRAEERLRHFMLTGKPLDARLSVKQI